jgi:hypothetical protein
MVTRGIRAGDPCAGADRPAREAGQSSSRTIRFNLGGLDKPALRLGANRPAHDSPQIPHLPAGFLEWWRG